MQTNTALDFYFNEHVLPKASCWARVEYAMKPLKAFFQDTLLIDVDIPKCRQYAAFREGIKDSTIRKELGVLSAAANHCLKWRKITLADMPVVEMPPPPQPKRTWLLEDELVHLTTTAKKLDDKVFLFIMLAYHTASRKHAIETLTWSQIDLEAKRISLRDPEFIETKKRKPIVPITDEMVTHLAERKAKSKNSFVLGYSSDIRRRFDAVAEAAGLAVLPKKGLREAGRLTPHLLRHSRATHLLQKGKTPFMVATLLGDNVTTVLRVYGHYCSDYLAGIL